MRKWTFSAGPAAIPEEVLKEAQAEILQEKRQEEEELRQEVEEKKKMMWSKF